MITAAIIQARYGSSRLPGKVLMDLGRKPVLAHVLERCQAIAGVDEVICAIPDDPRSDAVADLAQACGVRVLRGSEQDVLDRYWQAARAVQADVILRVTSDCPLIDPDICAQVLDLRAREQAHYACNNMPASFPHGLDCEAFTFAALEEAARCATEPAAREHVTPYIRQNPHFRRVNLSCPHGNLSHHRWTLDYPEDLEMLRELIKSLKPQQARMRDLLEVLARHPDIADINRARVTAHG